jgi:proteasome lid subunit RPN8/RPN11
MSDNSQGHAIGSNLTQLSPTSKNTYVLLHPEAYFKIIYHSLTFANSLLNKKNWIEAMGWISGRIIEDKEKRKEIIHLTKAWPISHGDAVSVKIDNYGLTLTKVISKLSSSKETILGWYHSHPSFGLFMSQTDFETQLSYQRMYDKAIALVFDHTLWSSINLGIEAYRLLSDFQTFEIIPVKITNEYSRSMSLSLHNLYMKKLSKGIILDELDTV